MSETVQIIPSDWDDDAIYQDPPLLERDGYVETESSILAVTRNLLGAMDRPMNEGCMPTTDILAGLANAQRLVADLPTEPAESEPDPSEAFKDDGNSRFSQSRVALIALADACTSVWWRSDVSAPIAAVARARARVLALLLDHLSGYYGLQADDSVVIGQPADVRRMNVVGEVQTGDRQLFGKVADVVHVGFTLHSGEQHRLPDIRRYVNEMIAVNEDLMRQTKAHNLRVS